MTAATSTADWILAEGWREGLFMQCIEEGAPTPLPFNMDPSVGCSKARSAGDKREKSEISGWRLFKPWTRTSERADLCVDKLFFHQNWRLLSDQQAAFYSFHLSTVIQLSRSREKSESAKEQLSFSLEKTRTKEIISLLKQLWWLELKIQETFLKIKRALETVCLEIFSLMIYFGLLTKSPGTRYTFFCKRKRARQ